MNRFYIDSNRIKDWNSFHLTFEDALNFPSYYGRNMNAWIDCMDELSSEPTLIDMGDCSKTDSKYVMAVLECAAFVNHRKIEAKEDPTLLVAAYNFNNNG